MTSRRTLPADARCCLREPTLNVHPCRYDRTSRNDTLPIPIPICFVLRYYVYDPNEWQLPSTVPSISLQNGECRSKLLVMSSDVDNITVNITKKHAQKLLVSTCNHYYIKISTPGSRNVFRLTWCATNMSRQRRRQTDCSRGSHWHYCHRETQRRRHMVIPSAL